MSPDSAARHYARHAMPTLARDLEILGAETAVSAEGATIRTASGREIVDFSSGGFGYGERRVLERVAEQARAMPLSSRVFLSAPLARLARALASLAPGDLEVAYFCNSGAEALEGALKLAKGFHPKRSRFVAADCAYHGSMTGALAVCGIPPLRNAVAPLALTATFVPYGDRQAMLDAVDREVAAVLIQPVFSGAGMRLPPDGYLEALRRRCTETGALVIADEVETGLGRTGRRFGVDHAGIAPDILVLGGVLGGGVLPMGAYLATRRVNDRVYGKRDPLLHATTTGGNPAACAAALAALEVLEADGLTSRAAAAGSRLREALAGLAERYPSRVSGSAALGLVAGLQLTDADAARRLRRDGLSRGVLVRLERPAGGQAWIGVRPPLTVGDRELESGLEALAAAVAGLERSAPASRQAG